jgi:hypothetical protein
VGGAVDVAKKLGPGSTVPNKGFVVEKRLVAVGKGFAPNILVVNGAEVPNKEPPPPTG